MARQTGRPRKQEGAAVSPPAQRKSPKVPRKPYKSTYVQVSSTSPFKRPVRQAPAAKDAYKTKTKQTVSAAGIFKKQSKSTRRSNKHHKRREETPQPDILADLNDGIEEARAAIGEKTKATFDNVHASFTERLSATIADDEAFIQKVTETVNTLSASLTEEKLQTEFCLGGKPITEVFKVGDRVAKFKKIIEKEEAKLKDLWKQWDEVQNEYVELGKEVFGHEVFNDDSTGQEKGFRKDMELLKLEYGTRVEELVEEIEDIGPDILKRMKASEKELDSATKKEQTRLLQALL